MHMHGQYVIVLAIMTAIAIFHSIFICTICRKIYLIYTTLYAVHSYMYNWLLLQKLIQLSTKYFKHVTNSCARDVQQYKLSNCRAVNRLNLQITLWLTMRHCWAPNVFNPLQKWQLFFNWIQMSMCFIWWVYKTAYLS